MATAAVGVGRETINRTLADRWAKLAGAGFMLITVTIVVERADLVSGFNKNKVAYESLSLISGILSGALASAVFTRIWRAVSDEDEAPEPTALDRNIREVLIAGALQGAVFGLVKAIVGRVAAQGYRRFNGHNLPR